MRILHLLEATHGGTRRHVLDLLPALQRIGIDCELAYSPLRNPGFARDAAELERQGIATFPVAMKRGFGGRGDVAAWRALASHLRAQQYDIVHCHSTKAGLLGRLAVLAAGRTMPVVYTPHCLAFTTGLPVRQRQAARVVERLLAPLTAHFIAVARHERHAMLAARLCGPARASLIYNGIDFDAAHDASAPKRLELGLEQDAFVIGFFGRLTRQKNPAALVRALATLQSALPSARVLLVGGGEEESGLRHLASTHGVASHIVWAGERDDARSWYGLCDVVAQPSRWEACPYAVLEAMAAARPVVARRVGGIPEIVSPGTGVLYRGPDAALLADHLVALAEDEERRTALGHAGRERIAASFRLDGMVARTMAVYEAAAARRG